MTTYHRIITEHPDYVALVERRRNVDESRRRNAELVAAAQSDHDAKLAEFNAAATRGEDPGTRPQLTGVLDPEVRRAFTLASQQEARFIRDDERQFLIDNADDFLAELHAVEQAAIQRAAKAVAELDAITTELAPVIEAVAKIHQATGDAYPETRLDTATLVEVARHSGSLFDPQHLSQTITAGTMRYTKTESKSADGPVLESDTDEFQRARRGKKPRRSSLAGRR